MTGCLVIDATRVGDAISVTCDRVGIPMSLSAFRIGKPIAVDVSRVGSAMALKASRIGEALRVSCSLVCTTDDSYYLRVTPEVIWLIPENDFSEEVDVQSNVKWRIE